MNTNQLIRDSINRKAGIKEKLLYSTNYKVIKIQLEIQARLERARKEK